MKQATTVAMALALIVIPAAFAQQAPFSPPPPPGSVVSPAPPWVPAAPAQPAQALPDPYAQAISRTGTVIAVSATHAQQDASSGNGIAIGAILGGLAGRGISSGGNSSRNRATIGGAVLGGLIGSQVERSARGEPRVTGYQVTVRFDDGSQRVIAHSTALPAGARVSLETGSLRVIQQSSQAPAGTPYGAAQPARPLGQEA